MATFNLHVLLEEATDETATQVLSGYVDAHDTVEFADGATDSQHEAVLEIDDLETYAELYVELSDEEAVTELRQWGPTAERFPVPVEHYALQQLSTPDLYEFYAIDGRVTLVICDSQALVEQLRRDVPPHARG